MPINFSFSSQFYTYVPDKICRVSLSDKSCQMLCQTPLNGNGVWQMLVHKFQVAHKYFSKVNPPSILDIGSLICQVPFAHTLKSSTAGEMEDHLLKIHMPSRCQVYLHFVIGLVVAAVTNEGIC